MIAGLSPKRRIEPSSHSAIRYTLFVYSVTKRFVQRAYKKIVCVFVLHSLKVSLCDIRIKNTVGHGVSYAFDSVIS